MAIGNKIKTNDEITYETLIQESLERIKSVCVNIDSFKSEVPGLLKNGTQQQVASFNLSEEATAIVRHHHYFTGWKRTAHTSTVTATVNDNRLEVATSTEVRDQLEAFLTDRGVKVQSNETISFKNMMAFYNNLASFLAVKLIYVTSLYTNKICLFYDKRATNYIDVTLPPVDQDAECYIISGSKVYGSGWLSDTNGSSTPIDPVENKRYIVKTTGPFFNHCYFWNNGGYVTDVDYSTTEIKTSLNDLLKAINSKNNIHYAMTSLAYACCSSSSSSSSSSCSSSSSSSVFIAYMDI